MLLHLFHVLTHIDNYPLLIFLIVVTTVDLLGAVAKDFENVFKAY